MLLGCKPFELPIEDHGHEPSQKPEMEIPCEDPEVDGHAVVKLTSDWKAMAVNSLNWCPAWYPNLLPGTTIPENRPTYQSQTVQKDCFKSPGVQ